MKERGDARKSESREINRSLSPSRSLPDIARSCARFLRALSHRLKERELLLPYSAPPKSSVQFERIREFNYACSNERGPLFLLYCSVTHSPFPRSFLSFPLIYLNASLETRESGNNGQTRE